ncbi:MAG: thiamine-monophosphate kinase [Candidatus Aminicenantes bacterium]|nr:thiamine-monophosphate kinase [Candidatus Aminicenantes bacterium]
MMDEILEIERIRSIAGGFPHAPHKINAIHEADAELVSLGDGHPYLLALTTDALVEEVSSGLYADPYLIGWMLAMVNFSDLAAVGADPLGLLISVSYAKENSSLLSEMARGVRDACQKCKTYVLGGDTNEGESFFVSGCAAGFVPKTSVVTRKGAEAGDRLYLTYPAGLGNAFAFWKFSGMKIAFPGSAYTPLARLKEGRIIRNFAHCCMDTSDGVLHTVDTLMRLNGYRFVLTDEWSKILHTDVYAFCRSQKLPPWLALAGVHGEFELVFAVSPQKDKAFLAEARKNDWNPIFLGEVCDGNGVCIKTCNGVIPLDTAAIRNLSDQAGSDPNDYIDRLIRMSLNSGFGWPEG